MSDITDLRDLLIAEVQARTGGTIQAAPALAYEGIAAALVNWQGSGSWKSPPARASTTAPLPACTVEADSLVAVVAAALPAQDGVTIPLNGRLLVQHQADPTQNGLYFLASLNPWVLTRTPDADSGEELAGAVVAVLEGSTLADKVFICTTDPPITLGATAIAWEEFTGGVAATPGGHAFSFGGF